MLKQPSRLATALTWLSVSLWLASLIYPGFVLRDGEKQRPLFGMEILFSGYFSFPWWANFFYWRAQYKQFVWASKSAKRSICIASALALLAPFTKQIPINEGISLPVISIGLGQVLWLASIFLLTALIFFAPRQLKPSRKG